MYEWVRKAARVVYSPLRKHPVISGFAALYLAIAVPATLGKEIKEHIVDPFVDRFSARPGIYYNVEPQPSVVQGKPEVGGLEATVTVQPPQGKNAATVGGVVSNGDVNDADTDNTGSTSPKDRIAARGNSP